MYSSFKQDLLSGKTMLGFLMMYPNPGLIERIGHEWDWFWLDCQHGYVDYKDVLDLVRVCDLVGKPAVVRVPSHDPGFIGRVLDAGAAGIMVPVVESAREATLLAQACQFPPHGKRSYGGRRVIDRHGRGYNRGAADSTFLIAQIETPEAIASIDAIAGTPGVDALMPGPDDLVMCRGGALDAPAPKSLDEDIRTIAQACRKHDKIMTAIAMGEENVRRSRENNVQLVIAAGDVAILAQGSASASRAARLGLAQTPSSKEALVAGSAY